jgi:hypothetical protein
MFSSYFIHNSYKPSLIYLMNFTGIRSVVSSSDNIYLNLNISFSFNVFINSL